MTTRTDTMWTNRLNSIMPANFMSNLASSFTGNTSILDTMINRIGRTVINSVDNPYNPFSDYTKAVMDFGDTIQEYKTKFITAQAFNPDPNSANPYAPVKNKPIAQYETYNDSCQYKQTIFDDQLKKAFVSEETFGDFIASQLDTMYQSDGLDKFVKWKKYMSNKDIMGKAIETTETDETSSDYGEELLKKMKNLVRDFRLPNTQYNVNTDMAISSDIDIIMRAKDKDLIDIDVLSGVYNLDKLSIKANFKYIDDFATLASLPSGITANSELVCMVADHRAFAYTPRTPIGTSLPNPENLYTNYWYTVQGIYSVSKFRNVVGIFKPPASS